MRRAAPFLFLLACGPAEPAEPSASPLAASSAGDEATPVAEAGPPALDVPIDERPPVAIDAPDDVRAAPPYAEVTATGLASRVLYVGHGHAHPGPRDRVTVHYTGWNKDGERFDSSVERGRPSSFRLDRVIDGWTEGIQLMVVGERRRLWIPPHLAYGDRPNRPQGMLVFDVELISIEQTAPAPETPPNLSAPPPEAQRSASGLAWIVLRPGTGAAHPGPTSRVTVHYSGWRAEDGRLIDSSVTRGRPATFRLDGVIPGWTEAVQLMVVGERRRFWIPESLAYAGRAGAPQGMLVFDIELLDIPAP